MKIQDVIFFIVFLFFLLRREPRFAVLGGLVSLMVSIPLFSAWIFFTAERLTWYAFAFFLLAIGLHLWEIRK